MSTSLHALELRWRPGMVMGLRSATHDQLMFSLSTGRWGSLLHLTLLSQLHGAVVQRPSGAQSQLASRFATRHNRPKSQQNGRLSLTLVRINVKAQLSRCISMLKLIKPSLVPRLLFPQRMDYITATLSA